MNCHSEQSEESQPYTTLLTSELLPHHPTMLPDA